MDCKLCEKTFLEQEKSLVFDKFRFHKKCLRKLRKIANKNKYAQLPKIEDVIRQYKQYLEEKK